MLLKSETEAAATYRLALIDCAYPSLSDNKVRKVLVKYSTKIKGREDSDILSSGLPIKLYWWCFLRTNNTILSKSRGFNPSSDGGCQECGKASDGGHQECRRASDGGHRGCDKASERG